MNEDTETLEALKAKAYDLFRQANRHEVVRRRLLDEAKQLETDIAAMEKAGEVADGTLETGAEP